VTPEKYRIRKTCCFKGLCLEYTAVVANINLKKRGRMEAAAGWPTFVSGCRRSVVALQEPVQ
jgi:hypothetical protein